MSIRMRWFGEAMLLAVAMFISAAAMADPNITDSSIAERVLWDKRPIAVHIQRHHERIIHFPDDVRYWLPDHLQHKVTVIAANGVLYIRAKESFARARIRVQGLTTQQVFLLDLSANDQVSIDDELIVVTVDSVINRAKDKVQTTRAEDWRVRLTRYAAQQLYTPERLLKGDSAIKHTSLDSGKPIPLIRGGIIESIPLASWQGGGLTVTAVRLQNRQDHSLVLQFKPSDDRYTVDISRLIRGYWLTATLQHRSLGAQGQRDAITTLYLVSDQPFADSIDLMIPTVVKDREAADG